MRILHVLSQLPDRTGSGIYLQSLVREAARRGHEQRVLAAANQDQQVALDALPPGQLELVRFDTDRLPFRLPGMSDVMPYPSSRWSTLDEGQLDQYTAAFTAALERAAAWRPDVMHTNHLWLVSALARRTLPDVPMVTSCHGTELRQLDLAPHLAQRVIPAAREVDRVLALTPPQQEQLVRRFGLDPERVIVSGGAVNTDLFHPGQGARAEEFSRFAEERALAPESTGARAVYVGKLSLSKGVGSLLDAAERLRAQGVDFTLYLVGGGDDPEADALRQRAGHMAPAVQLLGHVPQAQVAQLLRGCHLLVLPSFFEGLPLVILEALVSGCRVVVTDLPSIQGWPDDGLAGAGAIERVSLPPMQAVDRPAPQGLGPFADRLSAAMALQLKRARQRPDEPGEGSARLSRAFGWAGLFDRVERVYARLMETTA